MGNYVSDFNDGNNDKVTKKTHPSKDDWITEHATATGLAIVEVERLWKRFVKLGCDNNGVLQGDVFSRPPASEDIFVKNVLVTFKSPDGTVAFQTFCNAMKWAELSSVDTKMRAIFNMLANGQPVSKDLLKKVMKRMYDGTPDNQINEMATSFMKTMDPKNTGSITEAQWVSWSKKLSKAELEELLEFVIIPTHINEEAHRSFTSQAYSTQPSQTRLLPTRTAAPASRNSLAEEDEEEDPLDRIPSDDVLGKVASKVAKKDWQALGNKMGYTAEQMSGLEKKYPGDTYQQVNSLLKTWRKKEGQNATCRALEALLTSCRMNDAAILLL